MSTSEPPRGGGNVPSSRPLPTSLPEEARVANSVMPTAGHTPSLPAAGYSTPGLAGAILRVPGQPTLPDFDPTSLTMVISRLANDMYAAPPMHETARPDDALHASAPLSGAPSPPAALPPAEAPSMGAPASSAPVAPSDDIDATYLPASNAYPKPAAAPVAPNAPVNAPSHAPPAPFTHGASVTSGSPFEGPLDFGAIDSMGAPFMQLDGASFPLLDHAGHDGHDRPEPTGLTPQTRDHGPQGPTQAPTQAQSKPQAQPRVLDASAFAPAYQIGTHELSADSLRKSNGGTVFDPHALKLEFPILQERVNGRQLVWLDNAATTQKPQTVIDRLSYFYSRENSNIHRAAHTLAARATDAYESARESVRRFVNAPSKSEIIFVRGATEGINLVAQTWGRRNVNAGDEIVITWLEHHANIVPWIRLCAERGAHLRVAPVDDRGQIILEEYEKLLSPKTRLVSLTQVSNALGTITPAKEMVDMAHRHGAIVLVDGAQAVSHTRVDVQDLGCDFFVFSGHKVFAPTGIGAVWGKHELLERMPPWQGGGNMIQDVTFERVQYQPPPARFEAGTGNIADAVGLGAALDWVTRVGIERIEQYEHSLLEYANDVLQHVPGLTLIGTAPQKAGVISFVLVGQKTEEMGGLLDREGIAVRSGHHCAQPILRRFGLEATVRASLAPYNTFQDIDALGAALHRIQAGRAN